MSEDNENGNTIENGKEETELAYIIPPFPLPGDDPNKDYFLSQYISSLYKAGLAEGDPTFWFGRVIAFAPYPQYEKYAFTLNNVPYSMEYIINLIKNKDYVFQFVSIGTPTYNGNTATITAVVDLYDNRTPTSIRTRSNMTFTHTIRPTWVAYSSVLG